MIFTEIKQDLFTMPKEYALAHCISSDRAMGAGIAAEFTKMGVKDAIMKEYGGIAINSDGTTNVWDCNGYNSGYCLPVTVNGQIIFNLVTKCRFFQKPTLYSLRNALIDMQVSMKTMDCKKVAMPMIGCGLDRLNPSDVKRLIENLFADFDAEIIICHL